MMKRYSSAVVLVLSFLFASMIIPQDAWSKDEGKPGLFGICGACKKDTKEVIEAMPKDVACGAADASFDVTCSAIVGESGPVGEILCVAGGITVGRLCEKHGWPWIKSNAGGVAGEVCRAVMLCL